MRVLDRISTVVLQPSELGVPRWHVAAAGAAAAGLTWAMVLLVCFVGWMTAPHAPGGLGDVAGIAAAAWFVGTGGGVAASGAPFEVVPLGFWAVAVWLTTVVLRRAVAMAHPGEPALRWPQTLAREVLPLFAGGYAVVVLALALSTLAGPIRPSILTLPLVFSVPVAAAVVAVAVRPDSPQAQVREALLERAPLWVRRGLAPGLWAAGLLLAVSALLTVAAVVARLSQVVGLHETLDPGWVGGILLVVGQLLYLPTLALWALGWLAGPGFQVADGAAVTLSGAQPGLLPLVPVLGAVPAESTYPGWVSAVLLVPVAAGVVAGWRSARSWTRLASWRSKGLSAAVAVVTAALPLGILSALASGAAGTGRLAAVGTNPVLVTAALVGELALGALAYLLVDLARLQWFDRAS